jgi:putative transposase
MPRKGHSEEQIIAALKQYESGDKVAETCRKLEVSEATFYTWKKQYTGLGVQELRELRQLREENGRLKRLVADPTGPADPGDRLKKAVKPRQRCRLARWAQEAYQIGARHSARLLRVPWTTLIYKSRKKPQEPLRRRLREIAATYVRIVV